jgi:hypothetical protein
MLLHPYSYKIWGVLWKNSIRFVMTSKNRYQSSNRPSYRQHVQLVGGVKKFGHFPKKSRTPLFAQVLDL